jgi:transcriptional antiterminator NusG
MEAMINEPLTHNQEPSSAEDASSSGNVATPVGTPETTADPPEQAPQVYPTSSAAEARVDEEQQDQPIEKPQTTPDASELDHADTDSDLDDEAVVNEVSDVVVTEPTAEEATHSKKQWYVVKVQSGREDTIREAIERKVRKEGLEQYFGQIKIPVEKVSEVKLDKNGKKVTRTRERRLYAGYIFAEVEYNDRILYLFRETSGVGGFVGEHPGQPERPPTPMSEREIQRILGGAIPGAEDAKESDVPPPPKGLSVGDHVRVVDGPFNGMDAVVKAIQVEQAKILAEVMIFGRPVNVDFDYYQIEQ